MLYPAALIVRSGLLPVMLGLYLHSGDPLFITLLEDVGIEVVLIGELLTVSAKQDIVHGIMIRLYGRIDNALVDSSGG